MQLRRGEYSYYYAVSLLPLSFHRLRYVVVLREKSLAQFFLTKQICAPSKGSDVGLPGFVQRSRLQWPNGAESEPEPGVGKNEAEDG